MSLSLILPMSALALAASISLGPVNIVGLTSGARYALSKGLVFVTGATLGFIVLFLAIVYSLSALLVTYPRFEQWLTWAVIAFLLYLSYRLARDNGQITDDSLVKPPGFFTGVLMQWLNPKVWIASAAGIGAYTNNGEFTQIWLFAGLYLPICWLSLSCWVFAGAFLRQHVYKPKTLRAINRVLAALLAGSCVLLLLG